MNPYMKRGLEAGDDAGAEGDGAGAEADRAKIQLLPELLQSSRMGGVCRLPTHALQQDFADTMSSSVQQE
jgi:hypothetical protein